MAGAAEHWIVVVRGISGIWDASVYSGRRTAERDAERYRSAELPVVVVKVDDLFTSPPVAVPLADVAGEVAAALDEIAGDLLTTDDAGIERRAAELRTLASRLRGATTAATGEDGR